MAKLTRKDSIMSENGISTNPHIKQSRPSWDSQYYDTLAKIIAENAHKTLQSSGITVENANILDAGCGQGEVCRALSAYGYHPSAIDIDKNCVDSCKDVANTSVCNLTQAHLAFSPEEFDLTICSHVMEHMDNPVSAMLSLKAVTSKWLIIAVPNLARLANFGIRSPRRINKGHIVGWDCHHMLTFLEVQCGLQVVSWVQDGVTLPPLRNKIFYDSRILHFLEYSLLPKILPFQGNSLIVLCKR